MATERKGREGGEGGREGRGEKGVVPPRFNLVPPPRFPWAGYGPVAINSASGPIFEIRKSSEIRERCEIDENCLWNFIRKLMSALSGFRLVIKFQTPERFLYLFTNVTSSWQI
jgi:hypothetical protein